MKAFKLKNKSIPYKPIEDGWGLLKGGKSALKVLLAQRKLDAKWESTEERLIRSMNTPPKVKLEWLRQMKEFSEKYTPAKLQKIRRLLKQKRSLGSSWDV